MKYRYTKAQRLCHNADFKRVLNQAHRCRGNQLTLYYQSNGFKAARLGICIGKRYIKHATARNRIKRLVRESFRHYQSELKGFDIVVFAYKGAMLQSNTEITKNLEQLWGKLIHYYKNFS